MMPEAIKVIFDRKYSDESLIDLEQDLYDDVMSINLPTDENGFRRGTFHVVVTWEDYEE